MKAVIPIIAVGAAFAAGGVYLLRSKPSSMVNHVANPMAAPLPSKVPELKEFVQDHRENRDPKVQDRWGRRG